MKADDVAMWRDVQELIVRTLASRALVECCMFVCVGALLISAYISLTLGSDLFWFNIRLRWPTKLWIDKRKRRYMPGAGPGLQTKMSYIARGI